jgi:nucleotide-binding universal stress UspA family protein
MSNRRRSNEAGHIRKYLVVIDETEECDRAVFWAAKRAAHTKAGIVMLRVIEPGERNQQWLGVADIMKAEAEEAAQAALDKYATRIADIAGIAPERAVREGEPATEMLNLIEEDLDVGILVLAAGIGGEGPGPLVSSVAKSAGTFPIPVAIVPGHLSDEDLEALS